MLVFEKSFSHHINLFICFFFFYLMFDLLIFPKQTQHQGKRWEWTIYLTPFLFVAVIFVFFFFANLPKFFFVSIRKTCTWATYLLWVAFISRTTKLVRIVFCTNILLNIWCKINNDWICRNYLIVHFFFFVYFIFFFLISLIGSSHWKEMIQEMS